MNVQTEQTFTFFFSDIERSTRLAQQLKELYAPVLQKHHEVIRSAIRKNQGKEVDTAGDSFFATFDRSDQAVKAAEAIQRTFNTESWAVEVGLKVRIGLHRGQVQVSNFGISGLEIHRASRVSGATHGGQVIISETVRTEFNGNLPEGVAILELGSFNLKDFDQPELLFQLLIPGTQQDFPPPRTSFSQPRVAVLPFANMTGDAEQDYFCDGMATEIILALGNLSGLRVVARSSAFALKGKTLDAREAGQRLDATVILEGAVRKKNGQLRISVELVETETGLNIWSGRFDRQMKDVFVLQDEIAHSIARALEVKLIPEQTHGIQERHTSMVEAYDFYLKGRRFYYQFSQKGVEFALQMYKKAVEFDEGYALAYCGIANCYSYLYLHVQDSEENLLEADRASLRAIRLAPLLAEAHASRGTALSLLQKYEEAEKAYEKAVQLNHQLFEAWLPYARLCFARGNLDRAARLFEEASLSRPEDFQSLFLAGQIYSDLGIKELAENIRKRGIAVVEKHLRLHPADIRALYMGANGLAALGEKTKAMDWLNRAITLEPDDSMVLYNAGCTFVLLGMQEEALNFLERSVEKGLTDLGWFENDSNLDPLRAHPRFKELIEKIS